MSELKDHKIGFFGGGNMAKAIAMGLVDRGFMLKTQILMQLFFFSIVCDTYLNCCIF